MPAPPRRLRQALSPTGTASDAATGAAPGAGPPSHRLRDRPRSPLAAVGQRYCRYRQQRQGAPQQRRRPPAAPAALPWRTRRDGSVGKQRVTTSEIRRQAGQADSSVRPLRRRAAMMARPARVRMRKRNPWVLARRRLFGWNVRLPLVTTVGLPVLGARPQPSGLRRRACRVVRSSPTDTGGTITSGSHLACGPERTGGARARKNARRWRELGLSLGGGDGRRQNLRPPSLSGRHAVRSVMLAYTGFLWQHLVIT